MESVDGTHMFETTWCNRSDSVLARVRQTLLDSVQERPERQVVVRESTGGWERLLVGTPAKARLRIVVVYRR
jgi:hypothetical protein